MLDIFGCQLHGWYHLLVKKGLRFIRASKKGNTAKPFLESLTELSIQIVGFDVFLIFDHGIDELQFVFNQFQAIN